MIIVAGTTALALGLGLGLGLGLKTKSASEGISYVDVNYAKEFTILPEAKTFVDQGDTSSEKT